MGVMGAVKNVGRKVVKNRPKVNGRRIPTSRQGSFTGPNVRSNASISNPMTGASMAGGKINITNPVNPNMGPGQTSPSSGIRRGGQKVYKEKPFTVGEQASPSASAGYFDDWTDGQKMAGVGLASAAGGFVVGNMMGSDD